MRARLGQGTGGVLSYFTRHKTANLLLVVLIALASPHFPGCGRSSFPM